MTDIDQIDELSKGSFRRRTDGPNTLKCTETTENAAVLKRCVNQKAPLLPRRSRSLRPQSKSSSRTLAEVWRVEGCRAKTGWKKFELARNVAINLYLLFFFFGKENINSKQRKPAQTALICHWRIDRFMLYSLNSIGTGTATIMYH